MELNHIPVTGPIRPKSLSDDYSTHDSKFGKGDKHLATLAERDAVSNERRHWGMVVHVQEDPTATNNGTYQLQNGYVDNDISNNANFKRVDFEEGGWLSFELTHNDLTSAAVQQIISQYTLKSKFEVARASIALDEQFDDGGTATVLTVKMGDASDSEKFTPITGINLATGAAGDYVGTDLGAVIGSWLANTPVLFQFDSDVNLDTFTSGKVSLNIFVKKIK